MKYAKSSISSKASRVTVEAIEAENIANETYYELDSDNNIIRKIEIRDYNKSVTLLKVNKFYKINGGSMISKSDFENIWSGNNQKFKSYKIIKLWEQPRKAISEPLRYAKLVRKLEDGFKLHNIPDVVFYEIGEDHNVYKRINVRTYEQTLTLSQLDKYPILGLPCDNSLHEYPFPNISEYSNDLQAIEYHEFDSIWTGKSGDYQNYKLLKAWEI